MIVYQRPHIKSVNVRTGKTKENLGISNLAWAVSGPEAPCRVVFFVLFFSTINTIVENPNVLY